MEHLVGDAYGLIHLISSIVALVAGALVLIMKKGTIRHKQIGYVYVVSMVSAAFVADEGVLDEPSAGLGEHLWDEQQTVYGMADGSMLLTDQGWQEVKVGRVFEAHPSPEARLSATHAAESGLEQFRWQVSGSEYVASRGNYEEFTRKFEQLFPADALCRQVFISDGALWTGKWLFEKYPRATHILDYYHLKEKLAVAAAAAPDSRHWLQQQEENLFAGKQLAVDYY
jgi:hypothetical protein